MFDEKCDAIRNTIHDVLDEEVLNEDSELLSGVEKNISMWFTDNGIAVHIDGAIYHITIERVLDI